MASESDVILEDDLDHMAMVPGVGEAVNKQGINRI